MRKQKGIIAESRQPSFEIRILTNMLSIEKISVFFKLYFNNTNNEPCVLESASIAIEGKDNAPWINSYSGMYQEIKTNSNEIMLPLTMPAKDIKTAYLRYEFSIPRYPAEKFIDELKQLPDKEIFRIIYKFKDGRKTKENELENKISLKQEIIKEYNVFLNSHPALNADDTTRSTIKSLIEKLHK